jgi:formylglycine-generating enzyme required for sulfatase activity
MTTCGTGTESCCTSLQVTGGPYYRTYAAGADAGSIDPATVSTFSLDKYLVTVGRFRRFAAAWNNASGYLPSQGDGKHAHLNGGQGLADPAGGYETGWAVADDVYIAPTDANLACDTGSPSSATWTPSASGGQENLPINCVTWAEAYAFCIWDGGFLPSEAEWEYAAAGGSEQRPYPWGQVAPGQANQYAIYGCNYGSVGDAGGCLGVTHVAPVGSALMGAGKWGQLDLAGDVWEWDLDWYAPYRSPCTNCADVSGTAAPDASPPTARVLRGGNFYFSATYLSASYRDSRAPSGRLRIAGFRCARPPAP